MNPVRHEAAASRFVLAEPDGEAFVAYERSGETATVTHTYVPPEWRGRGVAARLLEALHAWAVENRLRVASTCSYASAWLARRPR